MNFRLITIIVCTIIGLPMLAMNLYVFGVWEKYTSALEGIDPTAADQGPPDVLGAIGVGFYDFVGERREKGEMQALFDVNRPTRLRDVTHVAIYRVEDVLKPGEAVPDPSLHATYILARAPAKIMEECPSVLKVLAKACAVSRVEVEPKDNGYFAAELRIGFLPADPPGDVSQISNSILVERRLRIDEYRDGLYRQSDLALIRSNIYATAQATCTVLRDSVGTCVVRSVSISERLKKEATSTSEAGFSITASFTVAHLENPATKERIAAVSNKDINDALGGIEVAGLPPIGAPKPDDVGEGNSGVRGLLERLTGGGDTAKDTPAGGGTPTVLNGGGAFGGRDGGKFISVGE